MCRQSLRRLSQEIARNAPVIAGKFYVYVLKRFFWSGTEIRIKRALDIRAVRASRVIQQDVEESRENTRVKNEVQKRSHLEYGYKGDAHPQEIGHDRSCPSHKAKFFPSAEKSLYAATLQWHRA